MINTGSERPIGYWLKKLDRLIDEQFEQQLGEAGLSRRQWQVINLLEGDPRSVPELQSELNPSCRRIQTISPTPCRGWLLAVGSPPRTTPST